MVQDLVLLHHSEFQPITKFAITDSKFRVGRSRHCELFLNDVTVSRKHAEVSLCATGLSVTDLTSRNGTFVDDIRISTCTVIPGQRIRFGAVSFLLADREFEYMASNEDLETRDPRSAMVSKVPAQSDREKLSTAQLRVLDLLLESFSEKQIANRLEISRHTVHNHVREIYKLLGVHSRAELMVRFLPRPTQT